MAKSLLGDFVLHLDPKSVNMDLEQKANPVHILILTEVYLVPLKYTAYLYSNILVCLFRKV